MCKKTCWPTHLHRRMPANVLLAGCARVVSYRHQTALQIHSPSPRPKPNTRLLYYPMSSRSQNRNTNHNEPPQLPPDCFVPFRPRPNRRHRLTDPPTEPAAKTHHQAALLSNEQQVTKQKHNT